MAFARYLFPLLPDLLKPTGIKFFPIGLKVLVFLFERFGGKINQKCSYVVPTSLQGIVYPLFISKGSALLHFHFLIAICISFDSFFNALIFVVGTVDLKYTAAFSSLLHSFLFPEDDSPQAEEAALILNLDRLALLGHQSRFRQPPIAHCLLNNTPMNSIKH